MKLEHFSKRQNKTNRWVFGLESKYERGDIVIIYGKHYLLDGTFQKKPKVGEYLQVFNNNIYYYYIEDIYEQMSNEVYLVMATELTQEEWRQKQLKKILN